jgi:acetoin utilization protein AcuB
MNWNVQPKLQEAMSKKLVTVLESYSLEAAYSLMTNYKIRHLPVTDNNEEIVGIISDRDLQRAMRSHIENNGGIRVEENEFDPRSKVGDYMTWPVMTVPETMPMKSVVEIMLKEKVSALIVEREDYAAGIVTTHDLLKVLASILKEHEPSARMTLAEWLANPAMMSVTNSLAQAGI